MDDEAAPASPEQALVLFYAPAERRDALAALLRLDATLAAIVRAARQPLVGQMRLTWWYEALLALDAAPAPPHPVLRALQTDVLPTGVSGRELAAMADGWETLLDDGPLGLDRLSGYASGRGAQLFAVGGAVLGAAPADPLDAAGRGWALADLARHVSDPDESAAARNSAEKSLHTAFHTRWSRPARPLGALALLARADLAGVPAGSPRRAARLLRHRLTGR